MVDHFQLVSIVAEAIKESSASQQPGGADPVDEPSAGKDMTCVAKNVLSRLAEAGFEIRPKT